jgi:hypothetical protein
MYWEFKLMKLFARKNGRKRWREKALLINPHETKIVFITSKQHERPVHCQPWIYEKLENLALSTNATKGELLREITMPEHAFASRIRQENSLESQFGIE